MCHLAVAHLFYILAERLRVVANESGPTGISIAPPKKKRCTCRWAQRFMRMLGDVYYLPKM